MTDIQHRPTYVKNDRPDPLECFFYTEAEAAERLGKADGARRAHAERLARAELDPGDTWGTLGAVPESPSAGMLF